MFSNAKEAFIKHLKNNTSIYFFLLLSFIIGVSIGAFTVNGLTTMQRDELKNYFIGFLQLLDTQSIDSAQLFKLTAVENIKQIFIIWILGVCIVGIPFIYLFVCIRGFLTGFTSGFIIHCLGMKGILYITGSMFLKEIIINKNIVGMDVVELAPLQNIIAPDFSIAKLIYRIMGYIALSKGWMPKPILKNI